MTPPLTAEEASLEGILQRLATERGLTGSTLQIGRALAQEAGIPTRIFSTILSGEVANLPFSLQAYYFETAEQAISEL